MGKLKGMMQNMPPNMMAMMASMMMKGKGKCKGEGGGDGGPQPWSPNQADPWEGYVPGTYYEEPGGYFGVEGLRDAVTRAVEPLLHLETQWSKADMVNKICLTIFKTSTKWYKEDERHKENGTAMQAQALLEEFVEKLMGALAGYCHARPWFFEIYLSEAIALAAIKTFKKGNLFKRTVAPIIVTHVDEAIFRYREEERHARVMWDAIQAVGISQSHQKKANKHLTTSFEAAHISAKYGVSASITPELGMVQDFVQAWMSEFAGRAWDVLENGIPHSSKEQQVTVVTLLFQYLCDPNHTCLPHDLTVSLEHPPPANWDFVAQAAILLFSQ
jgi:hypothetical protein